jgi:hypothetical protein
MKIAMRVFTPLLLCVGLAACSSGAPPAAGFPADALTTTTSDSGSLRVEVRSSPQPPVRGTDSLELTVTGASDGAARDGLKITVTPSMPAMGHGSADATVTPQGKGKYLVTDVYMYMAGTWVLKTTFSGPVSDHVELSFSIQ